MIGDNTSVILKGPSRFCANFRLVTFHFRFLASSQTLSPLTNGVNLFLDLAAMVCRASSWAARASCLATCRVLILVSTAGIEDDGRTVGRGMGSYPIMRKNGDWLVTE